MWCNLLLFDFYTHYRTRYRMSLLVFIAALIKTMLRVGHSRRDDLKVNERRINTILHVFDTFKKDGFHIHCGNSQDIREFVTDH